MLVERGSSLAIGREQRAIYRGLTPEQRSVMQRDATALEIAAAQSVGNVNVRYFLHEKGVTDPELLFLIRNLGIASLGQLLALTDRFLRGDDIHGKPLRQWARIASDVADHMRGILADHAAKRLTVSPYGITDPFRYLPFEPQERQRVEEQGLSLPDIIRYNDMELAKLLRPHRKPGSMVPQRRMREFRGMIPRTINPLIDRYVEEDE